MRGLWSPEDTGTERGSLQLPDVQPLVSGASPLALVVPHLHGLSLLQRALG